MKLRSIRFRLSVWYSLALTAGLIVFAIAIWLSMKQDLTRELDTNLAARARALDAFLGRELAQPGTHINEELEEYAGALPPETAVQVLDAGGRVLLESRRGFPFSSLSAKDFRAGQLRWNGNDYRTLVVSTTQSGQPYRVAVAESVSAMESLLARLGWLLAGLIPVVILISAVGGNWLSRRALRPVDEITRAARKVGIGNLAERLSVPPTGDELERLAETWNGMLARIEDAVQRLSRFTADASHELRTPLAVIRTTAEIAARRSRSPEEYQASLAQVVAESQRMTHLVEDLLFLARCDSEAAEMPMEPMELGPVVEEACWHARSLGEGNDISVECSGTAVKIPVKANRVAIRQLLTLLLDNAIKYSPAGAVVRVTLLSRDSNAVLGIEDRGIGIPESAVPHIFERFYRARQNGSETVSGYGLGLSLADEIAKRHGARIEVKSAPEQGSVFTVVFPQ